MASTYSNLKIQLMATGENSGTWGNVTNDNLGVAIEQAITGSVDITVSSDTTLTLTDTNAAQNARALRLNIGGSGGFNLTVPAIQKLYLINNASLAAIVVKNASGSTVTVPTAKTMWVFSTGTGVVDAVTHLSSLTLGSALPIASGGTGSTSTTYANLQTNVTGTLPVSNGGVGAATLTANNVLLGNGTSTVQFVAPGSTGNVLTSNGSTWTSAAAAAFDSGTVMLFAQTTAPTGWTKNTSTGDNSALRVVTGNASTGGSVGFTTAFASQTPTGSVSITAVSGSAGATTLSTPQIPSHNHTWPWILAVGSGGQQVTQASDQGIYNGGQAGSNEISTSFSGGGSSHTHPFSFSSGSGTFSGNAINLAVQYIDVIRASKN
jgi:hypothetical protein